MRFSVARFLAWTATAAIVGSFTGCSTTATNNQATPLASTAPTASQSAASVVASYSVLCDLAERIAQTTAQVKCLIGPGQDPHTYQVRPDDRKAVDTAKLVLYGGYGFEPDIAKLVASAPASVTKVAVHEKAVTWPLKGGHDHDQDYDHDHEKEESAEAAEANDPHVWHSAQNGIAMVKVIQAQLSEAAPENKATYARNAEQIIDRLTQIDQWIKTAIATIPANQRKLVTTHDALGYYGSAYGIEIEGALQGVTTEEQPTATRVKELVDEIKASQVPTIFAEKTTNPAMMQAVSQEAQVKLAEQRLFTDGLGEAGSGAETYEQMLIKNTQTIVEGLGGQVTAPPV